MYMKEDFLHYTWLSQKFDFSHLTTTKGETVVVIHPGQYLQLSGPDFFNAQLIISGQKWAGNVEIHVRSSDWYLHHHEDDDHYNNVILHVVWQHDTPVFRKDNSEIPVLELKQYVDQAEMEKYRQLLSPKSWIFCESEMDKVDGFVVAAWLERLFFERLERKSIGIEALLKQTHNDWEAVLFCLLAKNFGLNTNGEVFLKTAQSIPFSVIRKEASTLQNLEALLFGQSGLIPPQAEDRYSKELQSVYEYQKRKYQLEPPLGVVPEFFKHRPDNFPTIRLAQLSALYHIHLQLFSTIIAMNNTAAMYKVFAVSVSGYWKTHYNFDKASAKKEKRLSKAFIDLLLINTLIPLQFAYAKSLGKEDAEKCIGLMSSLPAEKNAIIDKFRHFGMPAKTAFETQGLLQLKNEYCNAKKCLQCAIGVALIKN